MPADERATRTPVDRADMFIEWCALAGFGLQGWPSGAHCQLVLHFTQALQEAARLAREDAARKLDDEAERLSRMRAPVSAGYYAEAAKFVRASITTDEG